VPIPNTLFKAVGADTGGAYTLCEYTATYDIPLHIHSREDEGIYVLEGQVTVQVGDDTFTAGPGGFVFMPRDVPHAIALASEPPVRFLAISNPSGFEHFMEDLTEALAAGHDRSSPEVAAVREAHGWKPV
jgi:quercetin dioxygenase-like cupin family protein